MYVANKFLSVTSSTSTSEVPPVAKISVPALWTSARCVRDVGVSGVWCK
jgi:hypothetical protein